jgi:hypothetical protein
MSDVFAAILIMITMMMACQILQAELGVMQKQNQQIIELLQKR